MPFCQNCDRKDLSRDEVEVVVDESSNLQKVVCPPCFTKLTGVTPIESRKVKAPPGIVVDIKYDSASGLTAGVHSGDSGLQITASNKEIQKLWKTS